MSPGARYERPSGGPKAWETPKPLPSGLAPVRAFHSDMLPAALGPWVADIAERMQCPPDFVGVSAMVGLATALGRKIAIRPKARSDWTEVPNLWGCIVGRPGGMKSPAMSEAMKPLHHLETEARKANADAVRVWKRQAAEVNIRREEADKAFRKAMKNGVEHGMDPFGPDEIAEPIAKRYISNDTTYEALGAILAANPNGILAFRDELVSLLRTLDREEQAAARGFYLSAWNGTGSYTFDRIVRGLTHIDAACLSMLGSTQPGRLADYVGRAVQGGAGDDGLIQRFGLLVWPDDNGVWRDVDQWPASEPKERAWQTFARLDALDPASVGAEQGEFDKIPFLRFDDQAQGTFREWHTDLEGRLRDAEMHGSLKSHLSKYKKLVPSLALINHLADGGLGPVTHEALVRALGFAQYLETHARRAYGSGRQCEVDTATAIIARLKKNQLPIVFTAREILQRDWSNLSDKAQVLAGLELLEDVDWVRSKLVSTGGRPKTEFMANPHGLYKAA